MNPPRILPGLHHNESFVQGATSIARPEVSPPFICLRNCFWFLIRKKPPYYLNRPKEPGRNLNSNESLDCTLVISRHNITVVQYLLNRIYVKNLLQLWIVDNSSIHSHVVVQYGLIFHLRTQVEPYRSFCKLHLKSVSKWRRVFRGQQFPLDVELVQYPWVSHVTLLTYECKDV